MDIDKIIKSYEPQIKKIAYWYYGLWPKGNFDTSDLIQAGREAVWKVSEKHPEQINNLPYIRGAIKFSTIGRMVELLPKIPRQISIIRKFDEDISIIDTLPANNNFENKLEGWDEIEYYIRHEFSQEAAESLLKVFEKCENVFDLNLSEPPKCNQKDKIEMVSNMDLSDNDLLTYACLLTGAIEKLPYNFVNGQKEKGKKYMTYLLDYLNITPKEFAKSKDKRRIIKKYGLDSFYQKAFDSDMGDLFSYCFPEIEPYTIAYDKGKWEGIEGLINAWNALDRIKRETRKSPDKLTQKDFREHDLTGLLKSQFDNSHLKAVEFRYPGTYPEISKEVNSLRNKMLKHNFR
ncbi:MAG: hypothetical protein WC781_04105 [Candidatus Pacearchaeota archaeon]|jgi:hypothetical protein